MHKVSPRGGVTQEQSVKVDVKEQFLIYAYESLRDSLQDFQKNRNGKPTKRMVAELKGWAPNLNLKAATREERIKWRCCYVINFLYDLVNVFSAIVVQRNTLKGESHVLKNVDWSVHGPSIGAYMA